MNVVVNAGAVAPERFEDGKEMLLAGLSASYTLDTRAAIPAQWGRFAPHLGRVPGQVGESSYGVSWNATPEGGFDYLCGVEVADGARLPPAFAQVRLPARRYAVFAHREHVSKMPATFDAIFGTWLPNSGRKPAHAPSFERYSGDFDPCAGTGSVEIWIPLES